MLVMYELAYPLFVQWVQVMTEWNGFYVHWSLVWTRRLPKGIMVVHQLPPYFGVVQFGDGHGMWSVPFSPHFYFFFFFFVMVLWVSLSAIITLWRRGMRCGHMSSQDWLGGPWFWWNFSVSHAFWGASFLNLWCFLSALIFAKLQLSCVSLPRIFSFPWISLLWLLRLSLLPFNFASFFNYHTLLSFSFFNFPFLCFVPFLKFCLLYFCLMDHSGIKCTSPQLPSVLLT